MSSVLFSHTDSTKELLEQSKVHYDAMAVAKGVFISAEGAFATSLKDLQVRMSIALHRPAQKFGAVCNSRTIVRSERPQKESFLTLLINVAIDAALEKKEEKSLPIEPAWMQAFSDDAFAAFVQRFQQELPVTIRVDEANCRIVVVAK